MTQKRKIFVNIWTVTELSTLSPKVTRNVNPVLVGLYEEPEKPDNPIEYINNLRSYIKHFLGGPAEFDTEALKHENEELKARVEELQAKIDQLTVLLY